MTTITKYVGIPAADVLAEDIDHGDRGANVQFSNSLVQVTDTGDKVYAVTYDSNGREVEVGEWSYEAADPDSCRNSAEAARLLADDIIDYWEASL